VPFCAGCDRFYNPNTLTESGNCPDGHQVSEPGKGHPPATVPWHFKLMVFLVVAYLGWRLVQLIGAIL